MSRTVLSLCDYSGRWSQPYRKAGYTVIQVDIKHGDDVRLLEKMNRTIHGILMAPPCTEFAGSGARHWKSKQEKTPEKLTNNIALVDACLRAALIYEPDWWVLENPVGRLKNYIGAAQFWFDPCEYAGWLPKEQQYDEQYTKRTGLWGSFTVPEQKPLPPVQGSKMHKRYGGVSEKTKEMRSMTPLGFATAFFNANK